MGRRPIPVSADRATSPWPGTPARKAGVLDLGALFLARDGLSAGGRWIRTLGPASVERPLHPLKRKGTSVTYQVPFRSEQPRQ